MPNQRNTNKRSLSAWIDKELYLDIKETAKKSGMSITDFLEQMVKDRIRKDTDKHGKS